MVKKGKVFVYWDKKSISMVLIMAAIFIATGAVMYYQHHFRP